MKRIIFNYTPLRKINSVNLHAKIVIRILKERYGCRIDEIDQLSIANSLDVENDVFFVPYGGFGLKYFKIRKFSSVVFIFHNITPPRHFLWDDIPMALFAFLGYLQLFFLTKTKARWITVSDYNANLLAKFGVNAIVCPSIIDSPSLPFDVKKFTTPSLLYVGRIVQNKRCFELLNSIIIASEKLKCDVDFYIVGNGKTNSSYFLKYLKKLEELKNHPYLNIIWLEHLCYDELVNIYARSWLYVTMSKHEGFGLPVCEGVAFGTPGIYTPCGGQEVVLGNNGCVREEVFSNEVSRLLLSNSERDLLLKKEYEYVKNYKSPIVDITVEKVFGLFCQ